MKYSSLFSFLFSDFFFSFSVFLRTVCFGTGSNDCDMKIKRFRSLLKSFSSLNTIYICIIWYLVFFSMPGFVINFEFESKIFFIRLSKWVIVWMWDVRCELAIILFGHCFVRRLVSSLISFMWVGWKFQLLWDKKENFLITSYYISYYRNFEKIGLNEMSFFFYGKLLYDKDRSIANEQTNNRMFQLN